VHCCLFLFLFLLKVNAVKETGNLLEQGKGKKGRRNGREVACRDMSKGDVRLKGKGGVWEHGRT